MIVLLKLRRISICRACEYSFTQVNNKVHNNIISMILSFIKKKYICPQNPQPAGDSCVSRKHKW